MLISTMITLTLVPYSLFQHRYQQRGPLLLRVMDRFKSYDNYFKLKREGVGVLGFSAPHKFMTAMRMLSYGTPIDQ